MNTPSGTDGSLDAIKRAICMVHDPYSSNQQRMEAFSICEEYKRRSLELMNVTSALIHPLEKDEFRHFGLQVLQTVVSQSWNQLNLGDRETLKNLSLSLIQHVSVKSQFESLIIAEGTARLMLEIVKREWPENWSAFDDILFSVSLLELDGSSDSDIYTSIQRQMFLALVLRQVFDIIFGSIDVHVPAQRSSQIHQVISKMSSTLLPRVFQSVSSLRKLYLGSGAFSSVPQIESHMIELLWIASGVMKLCPDEDVLECSPTFNALCMDIIGQLSQNNILRSLAKPICSSVKVFLTINPGKDSVLLGRQYMQNVFILQNLIQHTMTSFQAFKAHQGENLTQPLIVQFLDVLLCFLRDKYSMFSKYVKESSEGETIRQSFLSLIYEIIPIDDLEISAKIIEVLSCLFQNIRHEVAISSELSAKPFLIPSAMRSNVCSSFLERIFEKLESSHMRVQSDLDGDDEGESSTYSHEIQANVNNLYMLISVVSNCSPQISISAVKTLLNACLSSRPTSGYVRWFSVFKFSNSVISSKSVQDKMVDSMDSECYSALISSVETLVNLDVSHSPQKLLKEQCILLHRYAPLLNNDMNAFLTVLSGMFEILRRHGSSEESSLPLHNDLRGVCQSIIRTIQSCESIILPVDVINNIVSTTISLLDLPFANRMAHHLFEVMVRSTMKIDDSLERNKSLNTVMNHIKKRLSSPEIQSVLADTPNLYAVCKLGSPLANERRYAILRFFRCIDHCLGFLADIVKLNSSDNSQSKAMEIEKISLDLIQFTCGNVLSMIQNIRALWASKNTCFDSQLSYEYRLQLCQLWYFNVDKIDTSILSPEEIELCDIRKWLSVMIASCYGILGKCFKINSFYEMILLSQQSSDLLYQCVFQNLNQGHVFFLKHFYDLLLKPLLVYCPDSIYESFLKPVIGGVLSNSIAILSSSWNSSTKTSSSDRVHGQFQDTFDDNARIESTISFSKIICSKLCGKKTKSSKPDESSLIVKLVISSDDVLRLVVQSAVQILYWVPDFGTHAVDILSLFSFYLATIQGNHSLLDLHSKVFDVCTFLVSRLKIQETSEFSAVVAVQLEICTYLSGSGQFHIINDSLKINVGLSPQEISNFETEFLRRTLKKDKHHLLISLMQSRVLSRLCAAGSSAASGALSSTDQNIRDEKNILHPLLAESARLIPTTDSDVSGLPSLFG